VEGAETADLSFQVSGQVASLPVAVGQEVFAGQTLVALSGAQQAAALASAEANLETASATLASLEAGTRPEQLPIDESSVTQDQAALRDAVASAYIAADSAVHATADQLFTNPRTSNAALIFTIPDATLTTTIVNERIALEPVFVAWGAQVGSASFATEDPSVPAADAAHYLAQVNAFLDDAAAGLTKTQSSPSLPAATLAGYGTAVVAARANVAGALTALTGAETGLTSAEGALTLAEAGPTPQAVAVGEAQVAAAQAALDAAHVSANETVLAAPIAGTITAQNAHLGETVTPGVPLVSMEGTGAFEAKVPVSEGDVGKIKVGDPVTVTFDAYPGQSFSATITAVDPAATMTNGVASYQATATFLANDPRIQSGLTAHLSIITSSISSALVVPASAVISDGASEFVYLKGAKGPEKTPVTTGVESTSSIQILSGLSAGDEVLTFGSAQ
jgi:HlyD family secretion protein